MKKIYMTLLLLMMAIVSFAEDEVVKNGVRYTLLGKEARATLIDKELTDIVVDPEVLSKVRFILLPMYIQTPILMYF